MANRPARYLFDQAIAELRHRDGNVIVEVGAIRNRHARDSDGHSTLRWPADCTVWSIDASLEAVKLTRELTAGCSNVFCVLADGLDVLRSFPRPIGLLYLDGPHPDREDGRCWHLEAYRAATLAERSVLLVDDTNLPQHGKAELVIPAAIADGFKLVACDRQALLIR